MDINNIKKIVTTALAEDIGSGDITANLLATHTLCKAKIISQQEAILCGINFVNMVFTELDENIKISWHTQDGAVIHPNQTLCELSGKARALVTGERTALNILQTLSSTATLTNTFVQQIAGTKTKLLDTRKTLPGLRLAQKYAVKCGGGTNHRFGLYDALLIKENHIHACGSITAAVTLAKALYPQKIAEVEVRNIAEFNEALATNVDIIMLDNFALEDISEAVQINFAHKNKVKIEVSGGVTLKNIRPIAEAGVDYISIGMITKTVIPIELTMLFGC